MNWILTKIANRLRLLRARIFYANAPWERLYAARNPWGVDRPLELYRFEETNRIIRDHIGPVGSLLEVGSAEGHQTEWLLKAADRVHGVDISVTAVNRARKMFAGNSKATFSVGALPGSNMNLEQADLVVVPETIYYVKEEELPAAFDAIERLGKKRLMTVYWPYYKDTIKQLISTRVNVVTETLQWEDHKWLVAWW